MITLNVLNRTTGEVQFTAEIDGAADQPKSVMLGLAIKWAVHTGANLRYADLADANLWGADLRYANLRYADLRYADLRYANLRYADLRYADLRDADLRDADLCGTALRGAYLDGANFGDQWIIQGPMRSDGHAFFLQKLTRDKEPMVKAGCRYFTLGEAQTHWEETRAGTALLAETRAIVRCMVDVAHARGFMVNGRAVS